MKLIMDETKQNLDTIVEKIVDISNYTGRHRAMYIADLLTIYYSEILTEATVFRKIRNDQMQKIKDAIRDNDKNIDKILKDIYFEIRCFIFSNVKVKYIVDRCYCIMVNDIKNTIRSSSEKEDKCFDMFDTFYHILLVIGATDTII